MAKFRCVVQRVVTFEREFVVEAENDIQATDLAEAKTEEDGFEWGSARDTVSQCDSVEELTDDPDEDTDDDDEDEDEDDDDSE